MDPWTNSIMLSILAVWTLFDFNIFTFSCDARSTTTIHMMTKSQETQIPSSSSSIKNAADNQPPLCVYPPPTYIPTPPSFRPPTSSSSPLPPYAKPDNGVWCVAKPTVSASLMQPALDYACASGADCGPIQLNGACYQPDTLLAHASFAFNSYWQKTKKGGATCDFGGSAMLVTADPSSDRCHFINS